MIDGSNIEGLTVSVHKSDMALCPDAASFKRLPFYDTEHGKVAMLMCDIHTPAGEPSTGCTRSNLKKEIERMKAKGFSTMNVGFEPEFFLLKNKPCVKLEKNDLIDNDTYCSDSAASSVMREIMFELERAGIICTTAHHERSPSQYEITYSYSNAVAACDNILIVRNLIKAIALKYGYHATFMPKPVSNLNGSGLHTNVSLMSSASGKNAFAGKDGVSSVAKNFIAGILNHARGLSLLTNPTINSYKRLGVGGYEAPVNINWGNSNRSSMIRVPDCSGSSSRVEIRSTDSTANPYVAVSGILAAGLDGITKKLNVEATNKNIYLMDEGERKEKGLTYLPSTLDEALMEFEKDDIVKNCVGAELSTALIKRAKKEVTEYNRLVNSFDFDRYF